MLRQVGGIVAGMVAWIVLVTLLNLVLRHSWSAYAAVERSMTFTHSMMIARLIESATASLASGVLAGADRRRTGSADRGRADAALVPAGPLSAVAGVSGLVPSDVPAFTAAAELGRCSAGSGAVHLSGGRVTTAVGSNVPFESLLRSGNQTIWRHSICSSAAASTHLRPLSD